MPKGSAKRRNPRPYHGSAEPYETHQGSSHRRGGTHKVRDENKTDSVYDNLNYKELVETAKERSIYRKDMKKVEMAWALKHDDENKKRAEQDARIARQRKLEEAKKEEERKAAEKKAQLIAKQKKRREKEERRERDESVSDDTVSDADLEDDEDEGDEYNRERFGEALSEESWDSSSSESSAASVNQIYEPGCRLRLFEWPNQTMPSHKPGGWDYKRWCPLPLPCPVPYAPLKITTMYSKQKLILPGAKYPPGVAPDFVPILNPLVRSAARNGHLLGPLRKAVIERGTDWAQRTLIQGCNGHMYFHLGSRNETKVLADTYNKWYLENRKLLRVKGKGNGDPSDRAARHAQRQRNKARMTAEVYEASQYRPLAMCYVPAYLGYGEAVRDGVGKKSLGNLFFVRFPGCDVPHYYFWAREGGWDDPTVVNPGWNPHAWTDKGAMRMEENETGGEDSRNGRLTRTQLVRVRKTSVDLPPSPPFSNPTSITETIALVEHQIYRDGLSGTLAHYRHKWAANGKQRAWQTFAAALPKLWPSGEIPSVPPVRSEPGVKLSIKLATIDCMKEYGETPFSPLNGTEAWTRDDDRVWDVVEVEVEDELVSPIASAEEDDDAEGEDGEEETGASGGDDGNDADDEALCRRDSVVSVMDFTMLDSVVAWLEQVQEIPAVSPTPSKPLDEETELREWEERHLRDSNNSSGSVAINGSYPFCYII
ncbi:uncharacterized protein J4E78_011005 [Alternaria triticimaculans]|uniref:uncharacterized protein n=1 Tax=Alternaria triticimaculans TaxID=297637 RepID=UPI0020C23336|nr:uncharacterized protein J4E78_011005 [Alternaria triticimaculans]KAI4639145.1 hypothetical protein J4E78_011005 [Alternaria triticimaculans]